jgi:hypothetical protein
MYCISDTPRRRMYRIGDNYKAALELGKIRSTREIAATSHQEKKTAGIERVAAPPTQQLCRRPPLFTHERLREPVHQL